MEVMITADHGGCSTSPRRLFGCRTVGSALEFENSADSQPTDLDGITLIAARAYDLGKALILVA
jgi:hypothetical protein